MDICSCLNILWYGSNENFKKLNRLKTNQSASHWQKKKKNSFFLKKRYLYGLATTYIYIPTDWKYSIFKIKNTTFFNIFFYSSTYFFYFPICFRFFFIKIFLNSSTISLFFFYRHSFFQTFFSYFKILFYSFTKIFFKKIKFKGKGYYVYKNTRNTIAFRFGYSHIKRLFFPHTCIKFLSKIAIIMFGCNPYILSKTGNFIKNVRPINIFTAKGVRFTRQILYRKTGKVSSYR